MRIDLEEIVNAIQFSSNGVTHYLDTETGQIIMQSDNFSKQEYNEVEDLLDENWDHIEQIPTNYDADAYGIMADFIWQLPPGRARDDLKVAIKGRGAFGRFKDVCYNLNLLEEWYRYENEAYTRFAREWCEENDIAYTAKIQALYAHALPEDASILVDCMKRKYGQEDGSLDFSLEKYFSVQLRKGDLFQVLVSSQNAYIATGGVQWYFIPPTPENIQGRKGVLVNFWVEKGYENQGLEAEIIAMIIREARRRRVPFLTAENMEEDILQKAGFMQAKAAWHLDVESAGQQ